MPGTITVTTSDRDPAVAPHRISNKTGKDRAVVTIAPAGALYPGAGLLPGAGLQPGMTPRIVAYRVKLGGTSPATGVELGSAGKVCGSGYRAGQTKCGHALMASAAVTENVDYSETGGPADGNQTVNVWVLSEGQGWQ